MTDGVGVFVAEGVVDGVDDRDGVVDGVAPEVSEDVGLGVVVIDGVTVAVHEGATANPVDEQRSEHGHGIGAAAPAGQKDPAGHGVGAPTAAAQKPPAVHGVCDALPTPQKVPAAQGRHALAAV